MDSFYGAPRQPPKLPTIKSLQHNPAVPEVSIIENSFFAKKQVRFQSQELKENIPLRTTPNLSGKTFKQIYMANVPDRHLDLSLFEPPKEPLRAVENRIEPVRTPHYSPPKRTEISIQTEPCTDLAASPPEPTIRDLFKIIQQQNEQIMQLQRQVNNLKSNIRQPEIEPIETNCNYNTSPKKLFSFDVKATSFEFSFRPPPTQHRFRKNDFIEPKMQEIVECEKSDSLHLDESLDVRNSYVSNVPSIAIEMEEYKSSDDEEPEIGLSFYKELMNQVNNALKLQKSDLQKGDLQGQTMKAVKQATLQHLKNIGVNLTPIKESSEVRSDLVSQNDVSCAVQQLLMKYLPADKLAKVVNKKAVAQPIERKMKQQGEFSFATLQYMKKYNLIDEKKLDKVNLATKILDVTALKLQPKLL